MIWIISWILWRGKLIGVLGGRDSDQQTKLVFCIGWFRSILIYQQQYRRGGKGIPYSHREVFVNRYGRL